MYGCKPVAPADALKRAAELQRYLLLLPHTLRNHIAYGFDGGVARAALAPDGADGAGRRRSGK